MATATRKKAVKAAISVRKAGSARESPAKKSRKAPTDWPALLAEVPVRVLRAEQERRTALRIEVEKIPQHILDAEIERRQWTPDKWIS